MQFMPLNLRGRCIYMYLTICHAANAAVKDMASNLERKWRSILVGQSAKDVESESVEGMLHQFE